MTNAETMQTPFLPAGAAGPEAFQSAAHLPAPKFLPSGREIYAQGERCASLYQVEFGGARIYRLLSDGRRQISAFHLAGEIFGFEADAVHHFFAETVCATGIRILRPDALREERAAALLPMAVQNLVRVQEHLLVLGRQSAVQRLAAFLLDMAERQGGLPQVELLMSRGDIADYLGLSLETVSRVFSRLRGRGVIRLSSIRSVEIVRPGCLRAMAD